MKILVVLPTYNEESTIGSTLRKLLAFDFLDTLVVDDNSTDKTKGIVKDLLEGHTNINMLERSGKLGLGTAYVSGFRWGLERGYDVFFEMDADLSHDAAAIPSFISKLEEGYDMVIGSRYLNNTISVVGWDFKRLLMSKFGNWYSSSLLSLRQFTDLTSGYRCYTKKALEQIGLDNIKSNGYAFQIEMAYRVFKSDLKIVEIPIVFYERNGGSSKMNKNIVMEAVFLPFKLILEGQRKNL